MKELLYYPGFMIRNENWAKFALLYVGTIKTIVPLNANIDYERYKRLHDTDLFEVHNPSSSEISNASQRYGREISSMEMNMGIQTDLDPNTWKDQNEFEYEIYKGKMPEELINNLIQKGFAEDTTRGLLLNEKAATLYMWYLADSISSEKSISKITDVNTPNFNLIDNYVKNLDSISVNKSLIWEEILPLPSMLNNIPLKDVINFRNEPKNQLMLNEFHKAVSKLNIVDGSTINERMIMDIKAELKEVKARYYSNLLTKFGQIIGMSLTASSSIQMGINEVELSSIYSSMATIFGDELIFRVEEKPTNFNNAVNYISSVDKHLSNHSFKNF